MRDLFRRFVGCGIFGNAARGTALLSPVFSAGKHLASACAGHRGLFARYTAASLSIVLVVFLGLGRAEAQHTSALCPPQTATVAAGGTATINVSACASNIAFAGIGPVDGGSYGAADFENHGTGTLRITGGQWFLDYSHNGTTGIGSTDVFEITEADGNGDVRVTITITASASPITVNPGVLPTLTAGTPFSQTLTSSGGLAPYTYALQSGLLPIGVTLTSGGVLNGTPTQRGAYSFSVRSTDATTPTAQFVDKGYTGIVQNPTLTLTSSSGTAIQSAAFSQTLTVSGGVTPHTCQLETGAFPLGITVSSACVVSGTTNAAPGNYPVTIRVTDASTGPGSYFEVENYTLTVSPPPSVSIAVSPASVSEDGATNLTFTVTRSLNLSSPTTVNITTSGTATSGSDYTGAVATIVIPAGATTATFTIDPSVDGTVEADETVTMTVAAGTGYTVGAPASATATILNDDVPSVTVSVSPAAVAEDGAPNLVYTFTLNQAASSAISINYTIGGTAANGIDYATIASPLVIPAGNTTGTVTVNPTADTNIEADETVTLTLAAGSGYTVGVPNSATGTILNDDLPNLVINDVTVNEGNAGITNFTFTVSLSAPAGPGGVTFNIATANGSATAGVDYVAQSLTAQTIPTGSSTYTFTVLVNGDLLNEPSETFFVNVTGVVNAVVVDGQGVGTITNDDPLPSLSIDDVTVVEGNAGTVNAVFTVTLNAASAQTVQVNYATADGTATQPADYTSTSGTLTFTPGQTARTITVPVIGETVPEANETFFINLSGATNATISDNQGLGTITNDDVPVTVNPATLPNGTVATTYSQTVTASGGTGSYSFAVSAGALPAGLTLTPAGVLSGTPTAGGTFNFTITATDSSAFPGPFAGSRAYTVAISAPTIVLSATTLAGGTLGSPYSAAITAASGGTAPYSYVVTAGALPGSLSLNPSTGAITGTPSALGTFNFTIAATDSSTGTGPYAQTQSYAITVIAVPPGVPTIGAATPGNGQATIAFTPPVSGGAVASYTVTCNAGGFTATGPSSPLTVTGLTNGTAYSCSVVASNSGGTSAPSATVVVTPFTVPGAPTIGAATPGNGQATIAFTAPASNGGSAITGYTVTCNAGGFTATGAASPLTVTGLTNGTAYTCSVVATNAAGPGAASATVAVTPFTVPGAPTIAFTVPGAPTIGAATPGNGQATIAFTAPASNGGSAITGYTVTCNAGGFTATGAASPLTVTGLTNGTAYTCSVVATNAAGPGAASATVAVTPFTVPGAPTIGAATPGNGQATIAFTAPASNGGSAITGYTVTCNAGGFTATGAASPLTVTGLTNGTAYTCSVVATNAAGPGAASATVAVTPATVADAPVIGSATPAPGQVTVSFTPPASNGGASITGYRVTCTAPSLSFTASAVGAASPITVGGLPNDAVYSCSVVAINSAGNSAASATVAATLPPVAIPLSTAPLQSLLLALLAVFALRGRLSRRRADAA